MKKILLNIVFLSSLLISCQSSKLNLKSYSDELINNPDLIMQIEDENDILIDPFLKKFIDYGIYNFKVFQWQVELFKKQNKNIVSHVSENINDFYSIYSFHFLSQIDTNKIKFFKVTYSSPNSKDTIFFDYIYHENQTLYLLHHECNILQNITEKYLKNPSLILDLKKSQDFILHDTLISWINDGTINLRDVSDKVKLFMDQDEPMNFQLTQRNKLFFLQNGRKSINIDTYEYCYILFSKNRYNEAVGFELLIDTKNDEIVLFKLHCGVFIRKTYDD